MIYRLLARRTARRTKMKIHKAVVTVSIACAALILIVTGVVFLPNASGQTITIYAVALLIALLLSIAAGMFLWSKTVTARGLDVRLGIRKRKISCGYGGAGETTSVQESAD